MVLQCSFSGSSTSFRGARRTGTAPSSGGSTRLRRRSRAASTWYAEAVGPLPASTRRRTSAARSRSGTGSDGHESADRRPPSGARTTEAGTGRRGARIARGPGEEPGEDQGGVPEPEGRRGKSGREGRRPRPASDRGRQREAGGAKAAAGWGRGGRCRATGRGDAREPPARRLVAWAPDARRLLAYGPDARRSVDRSTGVNPCVPTGAPRADRIHLFGPRPVGPTDGARPRRPGPRTTAGSRGTA